MLAYYPAYFGKGKALIFRYNISISHASVFLNPGNNTWRVRWEGHNAQISIQQGRAIQSSFSSRRLRNSDLGGQRCRESTAAKEPETTCAGHLHSAPLVLFDGYSSRDWNVDWK